MLFARFKYPQRIADGSDGGCRERKGLPYAGGDLRPTAKPGIQPLALQYPFRIAV
jgi:hypothetical protein